MIVAPLVRLDRQEITTVDHKKQMENAVNNLMAYPLMAVPNLKGSAIYKFYSSLSSSNEALAALRNTISSAVKTANPSHMIRKPKN